MASTPSSMSASLPTRSGPTHPPKSKTEPYYSISPLWSDVTPILQIDLESPTTQIPGVPPGTGPALATISYTPRYSEAMSYLRAVMAANEYSERVLALTEDVIGMNAAHYTVWIYRYRVLRELWGLGGREQGKVDVVDDEVIQGVNQELQWLYVVSQKHLKNYQIWHHRQSLVSLLPSLPANELHFLRSILSLDTKNYHVWTYRQWLVTKFPDPLLTTSAELDATNELITSDVRNNSAWSHRYFVVFGHKELTEIDGKHGGLRGTHFRMELVDLEVVERELDYVCERVRWAPQNGSAWNYLKGVMNHASVPVGEMKEFCAEFVGVDFDFEVETDRDAGTRGVRSSHAVEMLVGIFNAEGGEEGRRKVREGLGALGRKWDPIRRKYWDYRLKKYEEAWRDEDAADS